MPDTVTFQNVTTSSSLLANASGYNRPTQTSDGKTLPHWLAVLWSAVLVVDERVAATGATLAATSESEVTVGTGERVFAIGTGKGFVAGLWVIAARTADPGGTWMLGQVSAYSEGGLTLTVTDTAGEGTHSDWTLALSAARGPAGPQGTPGVASPGEIWGISMSML